VTGHRPLTGYYRDSGADGLRAGKMLVCGAFSSMTVARHLWPVTVALIR
jgi:hypothetical protein